MTDGAAGLELEATYRAEARRVLATLIRLLGGFDAAEEATHEAFAIAAQQWPNMGVPANPYSWLVSVGRFRMIDRWRRQMRVERGIEAGCALVPDTVETEVREHIQDDELRLIFTCCHPQLTPDARIALTLREVAGLTTEEIARAYLVPTPTIAQRIVRAKASIRDNRIGYEVPGRREIAARLESVLQTIYLVFNEGYAATHGPDLVRVDLCREALRLGDLVVELLDDSETLGLQALMLFHEARLETRQDANGEIVLLENQDRSRWNDDLIERACGLILRALVHRRIGPYLVQAMIAEAHARAPNLQATNWHRIVALYDLLLHIDGSAVVSLNRAVAIGMRDGAAAGLRAVSDTMAAGGLDIYPLAFAARADMERRLGLQDAARASLDRALAMTRQPAERRLLARRLRELG